MVENGAGGAALAGAGAAPAAEYAEVAAFFDRFAREEDAWLGKTGGYHELVTSICCSLVPPGQSVLEIGSGRGDLLAALRPARGLGVDVSPRMVASARERHPGLEFAHAAGEDVATDETFDYIVLTDTVPYVSDLQALFETIASLCHSQTRLIASSYSNVWRPLLSVLEMLGIRPRRPIRNWVAPPDLVNMLELAGFQVTVQRTEILAPIRPGFLSRLFNGYLARLPLLRALTATYWIVARPLPTQRSDYTVSVIVPCRNESGSIDELVDRIPEMGAGTEVVFVEGGSEDDTRERIEAAVASHPERNLRLVVQTGRGKWNAVQEGFEAASNEILMILDGDMTVPPEELPKFYEAVASGHGELINGSRLVYSMEPGAMRFLNMLGNRFFAGVLSYVLGQYVKDTLCGTKVLHRDDWRRISERSHEFDADDPFGDFDILLGGALLGLKISNLPIRYRARVYGDTNIRRFSAGASLIRLAAAGYRRLWVKPSSN
ncbi:MAG: glycosyltransferase [Solirubrobacterales bacterium]